MTLSLPGQLKGCVARLAGHYCPSQNCGCSSVGRAPPCQGGRREFEPRHPLQPSLGAERKSRAGASAGRPNAPSYGWQASLVMYYVYLLKSRFCPTQPYIGSTCDLRQRLKQHNEGRSPRTAKFRPWTLLAYFAFAHKKTAVAFESYLKSGSGRSFANRHFL
jgi:putative endonuclease